MPIRPENKHFYKGKTWKALRESILFRAGNLCEGSPAYPECRAANGQPHPVTGSRVVLTIAHMDQQPGNNAPENLRAWCQRCHNTHDAKARAAGIKARKAANQGEA
jgi:5-methylcytosine-specific restriction endonuclease McrA